MLSVQQQSCVDVYHAFSSGSSSITQMARWFIILFDLLLALAY